MKILMVLVVGFIFAMSQAACFPTGPPPSSQQLAGQGDSMSESDRELWEGVSRGAYWWADVDPVAIAAFANFGIDIISIRLGKIGVLPDDAGAGQNVGWMSGGDITALDGLPESTGFRLVVETESNIWDLETPSDLAEWMNRELAGHLTEMSLSVASVEIQLPDVGLGDGNAPDCNALSEFAATLNEAEFPVPVEIGVNPSFILQTPRAEIENLAGLIDGVVAYFIDYDYTDVLPRITDRQWIDATAAELQDMEIPFTAVLPIFNRALVYSSSSGDGEVIHTLVDIETIEAVSTMREKGAGGTEFTLDEPLDLFGTAISEGDQIRVLKSLEEIDQKSTMRGLLEMAPMCREVALFRFPLIPGFDPDANVVLTAAGWIGIRSESVTDPEEAARQELDRKQGKTQQIIWMITMGLMAIVLMRMFSKGAGRQKEGGEGEGK